MIEQLKNWFDKLLADSDLTREEFLWGTMVVALLCASAHLLTMLITRWGDSRATSKSWVFSALLHVGCVVGLVIFSPPVEISSRVDANAEPIQIKGLIFEEEPPESKPSELWERVKPTELNEVARVNPAERDQFQPPDPNRAHEENVQKLQEMLAQLNSQPDQVDPNLPEGVEAGRTEELIEALLPDQLVPELLPQEDFVEPNSESRTREVSLNRPTPETPNIERTSTSPLPIDENPVVLSRELSSLEAIPNPQATLQEGPVSEERATPAAPDLVEPSGEPLPFENGPRSEKSNSADFSRTRNGSNSTSVAAAVDRRNPNQIDKPLGEQGGLLSRLPASSPDSNLPQPQLESLPPVELKAIAPQPKNYQLRNLANRRDIARQNGGTEESEQAVERSLAWLAKVQHPNGYWDADRYGAGQVGTVTPETEGEKLHSKEQSGKQADTGLTALAVLAFLGAGYTHEEGQYQANVEKALRWLVSQQDDQGYLGGNARQFEMMYCHGMVTYALGEAYGMRQDLDNDSWLRQPVEKGVQYVISQQNPKDGGWRYQKGQPGDMSMFGWQLMALKSAEISGIATPENVKIRMIRFLKSRSLGTNQGLASYGADQPPSNSMTAEALFCKQMLGINRTNPSCIRAVDHMLANLPSRREYNLYYWYYGTWPCISMAETPGTTGTTACVIGLFQNNGGVVNSRVAGNPDRCGHLTGDESTPRRSYTLPGSLLSLPASLSLAGRAG
ncbi:MAG: prenyltransferase/squalene oxidase repeat-containing protein [Planctomycetaceae bacterium]